MKMICKISELITLWADENQYVVRVQKNASQKMKHAESWYFSSLAQCFEEVFDYLHRHNLTRGEHKSIREVAEIILATKKEILDIMAPFAGLGVELKRSADPGRGREIGTSASTR